ncbi:MAG: ComF family protein [Parcubacteria group bacterium]|nr:ComF family protein [Parcubacteria group bacterium]
MTNNVWLFFLDLIFPIECLGCGRAGFWLCCDCFKEIKFKPRQYCLYCKKENDFGQFCPAPARLNSRSGGCRVNYSLDGIWIAALYDELLVSRAIKGLKYYFIIDLADDLSQLIILFVDRLLKPSRILQSALAGGVAWRNFKLAENLPLAILNFKDNLVVPAPLSKKRLRWRGFNQSELLARSVAEKYGLEFDGVSLIRTRHKKPQAKLTEAARLKNVKDCFEWRGGNLKKRNIILIDDVVTTGATLNECAKVLKAAGAGEVWGLVVAKG